MRWHMSSMKQDMWYYLLGDNYEFNVFFLPWKHLQYDRSVLFLDNERTQGTLYLLAKVN